MRARTRKTLIGLLLACISLSAFYYGVKLRRETFISSMDQRFTRNIVNAYLWGRNARATGVFNIYDRVAAGDYFPSYFPLDYPPLRLAVATTWQGWTARKNPGGFQQWQPEYEFNAPMLWTDTIAAMVGGVLAFVLVRMWVIRMDDARKSEIRNPDFPRSGRGIWQGMLAGLLVWFNPAALWNGYVWVQWDIWPVPFFLAAVLLACVNWWFAAGVCLAIGSCLKGQLLIAAPILIFWPLWQLRFDAIFRLLAGMSLTLMAIVFPWLNPSKSALGWYLMMLVAAGLIAPFALRMQMNRTRAIALAVIAVLLAWPWTSDAQVMIRILPAAILGMIGLSRLLPARSLPHVYALAVAMSIPLMIPLYNASTGWFTRGFQAGAERSRKMHDVATYNLPAILQNYMGWPNDVRHPVFKEGTPVIGSMTMKTSAVLLYLTSLLACGFAAARYEKRADTRFLLAIFLPWMLLYMLLPQMFSRYLMWAAVFSGILSGVGVGLMLLGIIISIIARLGMMQNHFQMMGLERGTLNQLQAVEPHLGWMLILITLIFLYFLFAPRPRTS